MKKDDKTLLWVIGFLLFIAFPQVFVLGIIGYIIYLIYKGKNDLTSTMSKIKEKYENSDKTHNYEVIDSKVIQEDEWKATKEYKH